MRAVKHSPPRSHSGGACHRAALCADPLALAKQGATSRPSLSHARTRAERDWRLTTGGAAEPLDFVRQRAPRWRMV